MNDYCSCFGLRSLDELIELALTWFFLTTLSPCQSRRGCLFHKQKIYRDTECSLQVSINVVVKFFIIITDLSYVLKSL